MEKKDKNLKPMEGIIQEEEGAPEDMIQQVMVIIKLEGEKDPVCLEVESKETQLWIVDTLFSQKDEGDIA